MTDMTRDAGDGALPLGVGALPLGDARSIPLSSSSTWRARDDDDRLPWLEPAATQTSDSVPAGKLAALVVAALLVLAIVIGGVFLLRQRTGPPAADPTLIAAEPGDYKVRPDAPGGMKVEGRGDSAFATSEGAEANGRVDLNAQPEAPVAGTTKTAAVDTGPKPATTATVDVPKAGAPLVANAPDNAIVGPVVQLGAFPSEAGANATWGSLIKRFAYLAPLKHEVQSAQVKGATVYRLRAGAGSGAAALCAKLRAAGQPCLVAN